MNKEELGKDLQKKLAKVGLKIADWQVKWIEVARLQRNVPTSVITLALTSLAETEINPEKQKDEALGYLTGYCNAAHYFLLDHKKEGKKDARN